MTMQSFWN